MSPAGLETLCTAPGSRVQEAALRAISAISAEMRWLRLRVLMFTLLFLEDVAKLCPDFIEPQRKAGKAVLSFIVGYCLAGNLLMLYSLAAKVDGDLRTGLSLRPRLRQLEEILF